MSRAETDPTRRHPPTGHRPRSGVAGCAVRTAADARAVVTEALARHSAAGGRLLGDACLAVTELVTNAIRHAGGVTGFAARASEGGSVLTIEIEDACDAHPRGDRANLQDPTLLGGRGWPLVQLVATEWEIHPLPGGGKRIRVVLTA
ncbi:ATP-binding protein [Kitasatospora sp. NA04385]|uniref:ATP-binding protein n=1 Tax=Kitasatospora sp. NA04385 TaxID=2742135 RepID=UPI00158F9FFC|nr:ATP-binding protein [Kitasatospora sp. NA04385]QKW17993.1 ATP-binding protein [Kitasatospora sp. NA04385]